MVGAHRSTAAPTALAQTLRHLADVGARDFYEGELARGLSREMQAAGGKLSRRIWLAIARAKSSH